MTTIEHLRGNGTPKQKLHRTMSYLDIMDGLNGMETAQAQYAYTSDLPRAPKDLHAVFSNNNLVQHVNGYDVIAKRTRRAEQGMPIIIE